MTDMQRMHRNRTHILGNTWCIKTPMAVLPYYEISPQEIVLMDTGDGSCDILVDFFHSLDIRVVAILITHSHYDHIGGLLQLKQAFHPIVYGPEGADGFYIPQVDGAGQEEMNADCANYAKKCTYEADVYFSPECRRIEVMGIRFEVIPCPGHSAGHVAYVTPDNVAYLGDAVVTKNYHAAAKLLYAENHKQDYQDKMNLIGRTFAHCVIAHRGVLAGDQLADLISDNIQRKQAAIIQLCNIAQYPITEELLLHRIFDEFKLGALTSVDEMIYWCIIHGYLEYAISNRQLTKYKDGNRWIYQCLLKD